MFGLIRFNRVLATLLAVNMLVLTARGANANEAAPAPARLIVRAGSPGPTIDRNIYGQFVEHLGRGVYEGIWVGEDSPIPNVRGIRSDVVAALRQVRVPVIRWPGGCFADWYHWEDGIGPRLGRPPQINASWGGRPDSNAFGTHEYMDFLDQVGAAAFVSVNVGSGSVREADGWLRYMTGGIDSAPGRARAANGRAEPWPVPYIGVGNENWGCGGNMTAAHYADSFRHYAAFLRSYWRPSARLIAVGADTDDYAWTETMMARALRWRPDPSPLALHWDTPLMWGLSLHFYTFAGDDWWAKGRNVGFGPREWALALRRANLVDELIGKHKAIMDRYDPDRRVALVVDEWGGWFDSESDAPSGLYLESTLRDAMIAGVSLNTFNRHADRVRMANIAQMVNVIQALVLTRGADMVVTPTWHVFDLYKVHHDAALIPVVVEAEDYTEGDIRLPRLSASASRAADGAISITVVNLDPRRAAAVTTMLLGAPSGDVTALTLTAPSIDTRVRFGEPDPFVPRPNDSVRRAGDRVRMTLPPRSVTLITLD